MADKNSPLVVGKPVKSVKSVLIWSVAVSVSSRLLLPMAYKTPNTHLISAVDQCSFELPSIRRGRIAPVSLQAQILNVCGAQCSKQQLLCPQLDEFRVRVVGTVDGFVCALRTILLPLGVLKKVRSFSRLLSAFQLARAAALCQVFSRYFTHGGGGFTLFCNAAFCLPRRSRSIFKLKY
jgi:hypothetical protein